MATAKNKIIRKLRNNLCFETVENVLNEYGYSVVFFNTTVGDIEIERYDLTSEKNTLMAFTYFETARIVFIDGRLSAEDKLYLALHELGHIVLGHLESDIFNRNKVLMDVEAYHFAYTIIYVEKKTSLYVLISSIILSLSILFSTAFIGKDNSQPVTNSEEAQEVVQYTDVQASPKTNIVYITPSGTKFHRKDCMYTKNKTLTELPRSEASAQYAPCKVCKP